MLVTVVKHEERIFSISEGKLAEEQKDKIRFYHYEAGGWKDEITFECWKHVYDGIEFLEMETSAPPEL